MLQANIENEENSWNRMVHPGGFEPPTARFVAEYSIQLSYGCIEISYDGLTETT